MSKEKTKEVKKEGTQEFLEGWDENGKRIDNKILIPADVNKDGKMYANLSVSVRYSKKKDTIGWIVKLGNTGKEMYIGASTTKLGRAYIKKPKSQEVYSEEVEETVL